MSEVSGPSDKRTISFLPELEKPELCLPALRNCVFFPQPDVLKTICDVAHSVFVAQAALSDLYLDFLIQRLCVSRCL